jgi:hypothetical protein
MTKKDINLFLLILTLALSVRLGNFIFLRNHYPFYDNPSSDVGKSKLERIQTGEKGLG